MRKLITHLFFIFTMSAAVAQACNVDENNCVIQALLTQAAQIDNKNWQSQIYREAAKTMAKTGDVDAAVALLPKITNPDTQALTIRGIGMEVAGLALSKSDQDQIFKTLKDKAATITHPPSHAIALTYIAMAQAFANDNEGAWATAADMDNDALRNKAYGETAEIQAESGNYDAAMKSIGFISSVSFRNKAYSTVSGILADKGHLQHAFDAADKIVNAYKKANAFQHILDVKYADEDE